MKIKDLPEFKEIYKIAGRHYFELPLIFVGILPKKSKSAEQILERVYSDLFKLRELIPIALKEASI